MFLANSWYVAAWEHELAGATLLARTLLEKPVLLYRGEIGFIDFDSFCQAEPALDLSLFLRRVKDIALGILNADEAASQQTQSALLTQAEAAIEVFLSEYESRVPVSRRRVALWEALDLFTLVLHCWTKVKPERLNNSMLALERHLPRAVARAPVRVEPVEVGL